VIGEMQGVVSIFFIFAEACFVPKDMIYFEGISMG
jgi:hypothetical protein